MLLTISWTVIENYIQAILQWGNEQLLTPLIEIFGVRGVITGGIVIFGWFLLYLLKRRAVRAQEKRVNAVIASQHGKTEIDRKLDEHIDQAKEIINEVGKHQVKKEQKSNSSEVKQGDNSNAFDLNNMTFGGTNNSINITVNQSKTTQKYTPQTANKNKGVIDEKQTEELAGIISDELEKKEFKNFLRKINVKPNRIIDDGTPQDYAVNVIKNLKGKPDGSGNLKELLETIANDNDNPKEFAKAWVITLF